MEAESQHLSNVKGSNAENTLSQGGYMQKKGYLVIDHGEELRQKFEDSKLETNRQIQDLSSTLELMWEVLWSFMIVSAQIAVGWTLMTFTKVIDNKSLEGCVVGVNCGICINILVFEAQRLKDSIDLLLSAMENRKKVDREKDGNMKTDDNQLGNKEVGEDESATIQNDDASSEKQVQNIGQVANEINPLSESSKTVDCKVNTNIEQ